MFIIDWFNGLQRYYIHTLIPIIEEALLLKQRFNQIICHHIYREAESLSKAGSSQALGVWKFSEQVDGTPTSFYHRPFIEGLQVEDSATAQE